VSYFMLTNVCRSRLISSLTTINISFCPELTAVSLTAIRLCPNVSYIECRRSDRGVMQFSRDYLRHGGSVFGNAKPVAIITEHEDQIHTLRKFGTELRNIYEFSSSSLFGSFKRRMKLCDMTCFPYNSRVEMIRKNAAECEFDLLIRSKSQTHITAVASVSEALLNSKLSPSIIDAEDATPCDSIGSMDIVASDLFCSSSSGISKSWVDLKTILPKDSFKLHVSPELL
jgi:hypothetical protein